MTITNTQANNAKPQDNLYRLNDGGGLQLEIRPTGRKFWIIRYRNPSTKKGTVHTIGEYPLVSIQKARAKVLEAKGLISQGIDPNDHKQRAKIQGRGETFKDVAMEWHASRKAGWTSANTEQTLNCLTVDIFPHIGNRAIDGIEPADLLQVIRRVEGRGALNKAEKVRYRIKAIFTYALDTGRVKHNPTPSPGAMQTRKSGKHFKALPVADLPQFLHDLSSDRSEVLRRAVQFALLTFARTGSIRKAEWQEIDWQGRVWNIPAEHMKMGAAHTIPLSSQALQLLEELKPFTGDSRLIFYTLHPDREISSNALLQVIRRIGWKDKTTTHGFRALASSVLHEAGYEPKIIEKQLAHTERNKVAGAYNYMAQYLPERVKIMQWWGDFIEEQQRGSGNVVLGRFGRGRA
jgi:integrase